jgi:hypothetical protein
MGSQVLAGREHPGRIGIFGLEQGANIVGQCGRVAQDLLPIVRLQPRIIILDRNAMDFKDMRPLFGAGRSGSRDGSTSWTQVSAKRRVRLGMSAVRAWWP